MLDYPLKLPSHRLEILERVEVVVELGCLGIQEVFLRLDAAGETGG
jgi:hypothetical protein